MFVGEEEDLDWVAGLVTGWFEMKVRGRLGEGPNCEREMEILGRKLRLTEEGMEYEADGKHREKLMKLFGFLEGSQGAVTNGEKSREEDNKGE